MVEFAALVKGNHVKWSTSAPPGLQVAAVYQITEISRTAIKVCPVPVVGPIRVATVVAADKLGDAAVVDAPAVTSPKRAEKAATAHRAAGAVGSAGGEAPDAVGKDGQDAEKGAAVAGTAVVASRTAKLPKTEADKKASLYEDLGKLVSPNQLYPCAGDATIPPTALFLFPFPRGTPFNVSVLSLLCARSARNFWRLKNIRSAR